MARQKIAVVNDDPQFLKLMDVVLSDAGYEVLLLVSSMTAFGSIRDWMPDLISLDLRLDQPRSGLVVLEQLKSDVATGSTPVIICSADHDQVREINERLTELNCRVLLKPFQIDEYLGLVHEVIGPAGNSDVSLL
jgi:DNA-binding response OmpR family regulator